MQRGRRRITVVAPSVGPLGITGCVLWLRADLGVTKDGSDKVSAWADQSGSGNDALQATSSAQLTWMASGAGGRPYLQGGTGDFMQTAGTVIAAQPYSVFAIASIDSTSGLQNLMDGSVADSADIRTNGANSEIYAGAPTLVGAAVSAGVAAAWIVEFAGASSALSIGASRTAGATGAAVPTQITVAAWGSAGTRPWVGRVYEMAIFNRQVDATDRARLLAYAARYGI